MRRYKYLVFAREFTEDEYREFVDYYGIYKWHAYCGAFENSVEIKMPGRIRLMVDIRQVSGCWTKVRYLEKLGFERIETKLTIK